MRVTKLLFIGAIASLWFATACETIKPYEKEYLLNPLMDDASVAALQPTMAASAAANLEHLASGAQGTGGSACPTCGG